MSYICSWTTSLHVQWYSLIYPTHLQYWRLEDLNSIMCRLDLFCLLCHGIVVSSINVLTPSTGQSHALESSIDQNHASLKTLTLSVWLFTLHALSYLTIKAIFLRSPISHWSLSKYNFFRLPISFTWSFIKNHGTQAKCQIYKTYTTAGWKKKTKQNKTKKLLFFSVPYVWALHFIIPFPDKLSCRFWLFIQIGKTWFNPRDPVEIIWLIEVDV